MSNNLQIPKKLRRVINNEIQPGESIRWLGQPIHRFFTVTSTTYFLSGVFLTVIIFSGIPGTNSAPFWRWGPSGLEFPKQRESLAPDHVLVLASIPFVLAALACLLNPLWTWQRARQTVYLITNERAVIIQGGWSATIASYLPDQLRDIRRKERSNGTGDLIFDVRIRDRGDGYEREEIGFLGIRNPREVENILKQLV